MKEHSREDEKKLILKSEIYEEILNEMEEIFEMYLDYEWDEDE